MEDELFQDIDGNTLSIECHVELVNIPGIEGETGIVVGLGGPRGAHSVHVRREGSQRAQELNPAYLRVITPTKGEAL